MNPIISQKEGFKNPLFTVSRNSVIPVLIFKSLFDLFHKAFLFFVPGVILFASHDHQFVQTTANRIMEFLPDGTMIDKVTTYDEYLSSDEMARKRFVYTANKEDDDN